MPASSCPFCAIVAGRASAHRVLDEPAVVGFLDRRPVFPGHVLLVPREHIPTLRDLPPEAAGALMNAGQRVARALEEGIASEGTFLAINDKVSQSVPHLHLHVVPRRSKDGLRGFFWPRHPYASDDEGAQIAARIRACL